VIASFYDGIVFWPLHHMRGGRGSAHVPMMQIHEWIVVARVKDYLDAWFLQAVLHFRFST